MDNIKIENASIRYRNFSGREGKFNAKGDRNFCVDLDMETASVLAKDGWNVRIRTTEEGEEYPYLPVRVFFGRIPPKIVMISSAGRTEMAEDNVHELDAAEIKNIDMIIRPYEWEVSGKTGVKAYLKTMYVTIEDDEFADKYRDIGPARDDFEEELPFA